VVQRETQAGAGHGTATGLTGQGAQKPTLSAAQTADAIRFHTAQPRKYTKQVITDIQNAVGATATGVMNDETVQAIAARQAAINADRTPTPPLVVDGKAGPRTLPILIPVGLATDEEINAYTTDIEGMKDEFDKATTPEQRAKLILDKINARLNDVGVPKIIEPVIIDDSLNAFAQDKWTMTMSKTALANPKEAAATMYHEARHAEQAFRIARMLKGQKKYTLEQISAKVPILIDVLKGDFKPLEPGTTEAAEAEGWHEDEPGRPTRAQRKARLKATAKDFLAAALAFKKDETPANLERARIAYDAFNTEQIRSYRDDPIEYDGFFVGEKVGDKLGVSRGKPLPPLKEAIDLVTKDQTLANDLLGQ
jgi:hypothetical protein